MAWTQGILGTSSRRDECKGDVHTDLQSRRVVSTSVHTKTVMVETEVKTTEDLHPRQGSLPLLERVGDSVDTRRQSRRHDNGRETRLRRPVESASQCIRAQLTPSLVK